MNLPEKLPREYDKKIQEILLSDSTISQKAYQIESYYKSFIPYNRTRGRSQEKPELSYMQIKMILESRL